MGERIAPLNPPELDTAKPLSLEKKEQASEYGEKHEHA
jgi:hypothetical protein